MNFVHEQKMYIRYDMLLKLKTIKIMNEIWVMLYSILRLDKGIEKYLDEANNKIFNNGLYQCPKLCIIENKIHL